jgi:alpha-tubulin suppressor-like RCC1 family protein
MSDIEGTSAGRTTIQTPPTAVSGVDRVRSIVAGARYALALREDGTVWAWGDNFRGQVASGVMKPAVSAPTPIQGLSRITALSADEFHALALREDGTVWTWGMGGPWLDEYEITGSQSDGALRRLPSLFRVKAIAAGTFVDFAVEVDR